MSGYRRVSEITGYEPLRFCRIEKEGTVYACQLFSYQQHCLQELNLYQKLSPLGLCPPLVGTLKLNGIYGIVTELYDGSMKKLLTEMEPNVELLRQYLDQVYQIHQTLREVFNGHHGALNPSWILYKKNPDGSVKFGLIIFQSADNNTTEESKYRDLLNFEYYFSEHEMTICSLPKWVQINYQFPVPMDVRLAYEKKTREDEKEENSDEDY